MIYRACRGTEDQSLAGYDRICNLADDGSFLCGRRQKTFQIAE